MPGFNSGRQRLRAQPAPYLRPNRGAVATHLQRRAGVGALAPGITGTGGASGAAYGAAEGASVGSFVGPIGTAVGAVVGAIAGALIHQGQGALRASQAAAIDQALAGLVTGNNVGALIPWQGTAQNPGLNQFLSALMTAGVWMNWDSSVGNSPSVNGNWVTTFVAAVQAVTKAIISSPTGAALSVPISFTPGAGGIAPGNFQFSNPGIGVGPDVISAKIIMGSGGLMYWMIIHLGETAAHASANANSLSAQKVFALMVDHAASDDASLAYVAPKTSSPQPISTTQPITSTVSSPGPNVIGTTATGTAVVSTSDTDALIAQLIAQGQSQTAAMNAALASLQANGVDTNQPAVQQAVQASAAAASSSFLGLSTSTWLILAAVGVGAFILLEQ